MTGKPVVAIVGAGSLSTFLAPTLREAGFTITEIVARDSPLSLRRARALARKVRARAVTVRSAELNADLIWFCVPDREIAHVAGMMADRLGGRPTTRGKGKPSFAFHSSGALSSRELNPFRKLGAVVASVHPLMTFVPRSAPSLAGSPFALEGDRRAVQFARRVVRGLGGESFTLPASRKPAYHAWATMTSPLMLAYLVTLEEAARAAGLVRKDARRMSLPIIRQTLKNYGRLGPKHSFSGPFVRGDAQTVARHLELLKKQPGVQRVYLALADAALRNLPVKNGKILKRLLQA